MATWDSSEFYSSLEAKKLLPLYFFFGEESFLVEKAIKDLSSLALEDSAADFNRDVFYGQDADVSQVRDTVEQLPMFASRRVVIFKEVQEVKDSELENLLPLIERPVESTVFILAASKLDKRKKWVKRLIDSGIVVEFKRPFENQISNWVRYICSLYGLEISLEGSAILHEMVGGRLVDIDAEVRKLSQYLGDRKKIEEDDVRRIVSRVRVDSVFDLTNAIGNNDRAGALVYLANLLEHDQNEIGIVSLVARHVRILAAVKDGMRQGLSGPKLSSAVGVSPYFLKDYVAQSKSWSEGKINHTLQILATTDMALKSSPVSAHIWLENFIVKTCS